jgi:hypothetical protein
MANKDGLEPRQSIDFETLQRVKRQQREAAKNAKSEPKSKDKRRSAGSEDVREAGEPSVSDVLRSTTPKGTKGS